MNKPKPVSDDQLAEARRMIRALTSENIKKAEALSKKIDQLENAGMVSSAQEYRHKLVQMVHLKSKTLEGQEEQPMTYQEIKYIQKVRRR